MAAASSRRVASNLGTMVVMAEIMACAVFTGGKAKRFALGRLGCRWQSPAGWCGSATARWIWLLEFNALSAIAAGPGYLAARRVVGFGSLAGDYPATRLPRARQRQRPAAALFDRGDENRCWAFSRYSVVGGNALAVVGVCLPSDDHRLVGGLYALMEITFSACWPITRWKILSASFCSVRACVCCSTFNRAGTDRAGSDRSGFYHLLNHSPRSKACCFWARGSIWFRTGHRDIEKLGVRANGCHISIAMLVGLMAMHAAASAAERLFAGEWVGFISPSSNPHSGAFAGRSLGPLLAVGPAITGAPGGDVYGVYGVTFGRAAHEVEAENASAARRS